MTSETRECPKTDCITNPCLHKRPPITEGGYCVDFNNGKVRSGIPQEEKKQVFVCGKCLRKGDVVVSYTVLSRGSCERCQKTRSCYAVK